MRGAEEIRLQKRALFGAQRVRARVESPDTLARGVAREGRARALSIGGGGAEEIRFHKRALLRGV